MNRVVKRAAPGASQIDVNNQKQLAIWVACLLGFLFLRKSNLVPDNLKFKKSRKQIAHEDVRLHQLMMLIVLSWTKTIQSNERKLMLPFPRTNSKTGPVKWFSLYITKVPAAACLRAFCYKKGNRLVPVMYPVLNAQTKTWVHSLGVNPCKHSSHSLRRGGTTHTFQKNLTT